jgi:hypothetical protein
VGLGLQLSARELSLQAKQQQQQQQQHRRGSAGGQGQLAGASGKKASSKPGQERLQQLVGLPLLLAGLPQLPLWVPMQLQLLLLLLLQHRRNSTGAQKQPKVTSRRASKISSKPGQQLVRVCLQLATRRPVLQRQLQEFSGRAWGWRQQKQTSGLGNEAAREPMLLQQQW